MALNLSNATSYHGRASAYLITRPVAEADTFKKGVIVMQSTDKQFVLRRLEIANFIIPYSPTPIDSSTITYDEVITPINLFEVYTTFNPIDLRETWSVEDMQAQLLNTPLAPNDTNFLLMHMFREFNLFVDQLIWRGDTKFDLRGSNPVDPATVGLPEVDQRIVQNQLSVFDGIIKQIQNDPTANNLTGYVLTATNSVAALQTVYSSIALGVTNSYGNIVGNQLSMIGQYGDFGLRFLFSKQTQQLLEQNYNITTTFKNWGFYQNLVDNAFLGYQMISISGFPNNTILASFANTDPLRSQTFFYYNDEADQSNFEMKQLPFPSDLWGIKGLFKIGAGTGWMDQITLWTNLNYIGN